MSDSLDEIAISVAEILQRQLQAKDLVKLMSVVFLEVDEAAELLRVKRKTIQSWVSENKIPYRKANGHVLFLLPELLAWTNPEPDPQRDPHARHRLTVAAGGRFAGSRLAATRGRDK